MAFNEKIRADGLTPPDPIDPGKLYRFSTNDDPRDDAGWCRLFPDGLGGVYGDWRTGLQGHWQAEREKPYTPEEREIFRQRCEQERREREVEQRRRHEAAALKAMQIWKSSIPAPIDNPYLLRKQIPSVASLREIDASAAAKILGYAPQSKGEPLAGRLLVVPVKIGDALSTMELIDGDGRKSALAGGAKARGYWAAQPLPDGDGADLKFLIGEGVATGLSAREATGYPVIAALSSGNLLAVAKWMRARYPSAVLVILADLLKSTGKPDPHAIEAALAVAGRLAIPEIGDFNDMMQHRDSETVRAAIDKSGVTGVTGVTVNNGAASGVTPDEIPGVTGVTNSIPNEKDRPIYCVFDDWVEHGGGAKCRPGVWFFGTKAGKGDDPPTLTQQWICSPLHIEAVTRDGQDNNFGRLLRFKTTLGRWREWSMPMELLRGAGDELRGELLAMGVEIDPLAKTLLGRYLQAERPEHSMRCALQVGWLGDSFVLPDTVIGPESAGVIFQSGERGHDEHTRAGTLDGWRSEIAARAVGNPFLMLGLSASFAGPVLGLCNAEGGGAHVVGDSSTGKTTIIVAACSTWGGENFLRSWRTTANGMEGAAALFNDCLLALDEISECDPREVGAIVYALGNGRGKQRANRYGNARSVTRWRCFVLSSGEKTIATTMLDGGYRSKAGQSVRLLDVPATRIYGVWDELHGSPSGAAFSDVIRQASVAHHGHAGRAFLEKLTSDSRDFGAWLERIKALPEFEATDGQDKRAAGRFALVALAGEAATGYGITGWAEGAAIESAAVGFNAWKSLRGGRGNDEPRQILEQASGFIERHGDSRFSDADTHGVTRINRAGWWRVDDDGNLVYLFNAEGLREALKGFDFKRALDVLQETGALPPADSSGKRAKPYRIDGRVVKLYPILSEKLEADPKAAGLVTPVTPAKIPGVTRETAPHIAVTPVTPVTPGNVISERVTAMDNDTSNGSDDSTVRESGNRQRPSEKNSNEINVAGETDDSDGSACPLHTTHDASEEVCMSDLEQQQVTFTENEGDRGNGSTAPHNGNGKVLVRRYGKGNFEGYEALQVPAPSGEAVYIATSIRNGICGEEVDYENRVIRLLAVKPAALGRKSVVL